MEDLSAFNLKLFFFIENLLRKAKQRVCYSICFTLTRINLKKITRKFLGLTNLTKAQPFYIYKLLKIIIVNEKKYFIFPAFQIVLLNYEYLNNSQKLIIVSFISSFGWNNFTQIVNDPVLSTQII